VVVALDMEVAVVAAATMTVVDMEVAEEVDMIAIRHAVSCLSS
jgi:hypothetical protein